MVPCISTPVGWSAFFLFGGVGMKRRNSYLTNFSTDFLFLVLEQNTKELLKLEIKRTEQESKELQGRINQIKLTISIGKQELINRFLIDEKNSLEKIARLLCKSKGIHKEVYQEVFTRKILEQNNLIPVDLLQKVMDYLDLEQIMTIMRKKDTIYSQLASERYDEIIFDVDEEVYQEYLQKRREWKV